METMVRAEPVASSTEARLRSREGEGRWCWAAPYEAGSRYWRARLWPRRKGSLESPTSVTTPWPTASAPFSAAPRRQRLLQIHHAQASPRLALFDTQKISGKVLFPSA